MALISVSGNFYLGFRVNNVTRFFIMLLNILHSFNLQLNIMSLHNISGLRITTGMEVTTRYTKQQTEHGKII